MDSREWEEVNELFHRALAEPRERRQAFVEASCGDRPQLRHEVVSLLAAHDDAAEFIEQPAVASEFSTSDINRHASVIGEQLGQYRIVRVLGEGGMGIVYLAEDTRLGRMVALKAVAPRFTDDKGRRERLRREARAAASLTHPGIATVYALEEFDARLYIVGEYIPGETLREELHRGPIAADRVIDTALAIARALAVAHDRGVVHRDLKPENVIRTPDGAVKILDFGLARFRDASQSHTQLTADGTLFGTPAYMSPEQLRGETVDFHSDQFSFGVLLYELVSGANPFAMPDPASTIARILEVEPSPMADGHLLDDIVQKCLKKTAAARYTSTHDLVRALEERAVAVGVGRAGTRRVGAVEIGAVEISAVEVGAVEVGAAAKSRGLVVAAGREPEHLLWWWQFHQAAASTVDCVLLAPLWLTHHTTPRLPGLLLFIAGLVAAIVAVTLRLHLWFTVRSMPAELADQRGRTGAWIRAADRFFAGVLVVAGVVALTDQTTLAVILIGSAVAVLLSSTVIEPATSRAALGKD